MAVRTAPATLSDYNQPVDLVNTMLEGGGMIDQVGIYIVVLMLCAYWYMVKL